MKRGALYRAADNRCVVPQARYAASTWERMRGLLGRPPLQRGEGLLIDPCPSVHTIGMAYALDLAFLDASSRVVKLVAALPPWRMAACASARATLELPPGALAEQDIAVGDVLEWRDAIAA